MASTPVNVSWGDAQLLLPKPASLDHSAPQSRQLGTVNSPPSWFEAHQLA